MTYYGCHVDHIIAEKHGGMTTADNLAYSCAFCNRAKGSDIGSLSHPDGGLIRFFNPRTDVWPEHFRMDYETFEIVALTKVGEATARIFRFNDPARIAERSFLPPEN